MDKVDVTLDGLLSLCVHAGFEDLTTKINEAKNLKTNGIIDLEKIKFIDQELKKRLIAQIDKTLFTVVK